MIISKYYTSFFVLIAVLLFVGCHRPPKEKLYQYTYKANVNFKGDSLYLELNNPLHCPLVVTAETNDAYLKGIFDQIFPVYLEGISDSSIVHYVLLEGKKPSFTVSSLIGNPYDSIHNLPISLPFPKGKSYTINQGYHGQFSHSNAYSAHAIDFSLKIADTITAAADGYVVGVIDGYKYGGKSKAWRDFSNFITIFHPKMNLYTQYAHLKHKGSFVKVGDSVKVGFPIALSGKTGFTSGEHLHFNVLKSTTSGFVSVKTRFIEGYIGEELSRGDIVQK